MLELTVHNHQSIQMQLLISSFLLIVLIQWPFFPLILSTVIHLIKFRFLLYTLKAFYKCLSVCLSFLICSCLLPSFPCPVYVTNETCLEDPLVHGCSLPCCPVCMEHLLPALTDKVTALLKFLLKIHYFCSPCKQSADCWMDWRKVGDIEVNCY